MDLRERAEAMLGEPVSPNAPAEFARALLRRLRDRVEALSGVESDAAGAELADYAEEVCGDIDGVLEELSGAEYGGFEVIPAVVAFNITAKITGLRRIRDRHSEALDPGADQVIGDVLDLLELCLTIARAYFKVVYIRAEYIDFSGSLVYLGAPVLVVTFWATQMYGSGVFPGQTLGVEDRLWIVAGITAVALSPFMLLVSYFSRLATLSVSTLFVGPFSAASSESGDEANTRHT